ncbi:hypothetical protein AAEX28_10420 [Lentisphaerota bacterium WC36G]|nr:hypothetical protein LJT99_13260 [Lentisphaerae bacterium WC36]
MLKHVYFLKGIKTSQAIAVFNDFISQETPRKIPYFYLKYCRGAILQAGLIFSFVYFVMFAILFTLSLYNSVMLVALKLLAVAAVIGVVFVIYGMVKEAKTVKALKHGALIEGKITSIEQFPYRHDSIARCKVFVKYMDNNGSEKNSVVIVSDSLSSTFKELIDNHHDPMIDLVAYKETVVIPLMFILGSRYE